MFLKQVKILGIVLFLAACSDGVSDKQKLAAIEQDKRILALTCAGYESHKTPYGDLQNNIWNAHSAKGYDWTQCLAMQTIDGNTQYGWYWQWPQDGDKVYAQPQITLGNTPWLDHSVVKPGFPIAVNQISILEFDYALNIKTDGELNLTSTLWLTTSDKILSKKDKTTIAVEMMVWTYASDGFYATPAGKKVDEFELDGIEWQVWLNSNWHDTSGVNDNNWVYLAFRSSQPLMEAKYDGAKLLHYAVNQSYIPANLYIADIQLGTEIMSGTGQVWLEHFDVSWR